MAGATPFTLNVRPTRRTDETVARARAELVRAVRQAAAEGLTQAMIADQIGRSQPEVSRLLRFHGPTLSLMELGLLEQRIAEVVGAPVDLVPSGALRPDLRDRVLAEAVPL